jgi:hypothetical protein
MTNKTQLWLALLVFLTIDAFAQHMEPQGQKISEQEFAQLLKKYAGRRYVKKNERIFSATAVYGLKDYRIIAVKKNGEIIIYGREQVLWFDKQDEALRLEVLELSFLEKVPEKAGELPGLLGIGAGDLDGSRESIHLLDSVLADLEERGELDENSLFSSTVAYCGQILVRYTDGHWSLEKKGRDTRLFIVTADKRKIPIAEIITSQFINGVFRHRFASAILMEIRNNRYLKLADPPIVDPTKKG